MTCSTKRWARCVLILYRTRHLSPRHYYYYMRRIRLCFTQGEKIIFEYFSDPEFIDQLIEFLSLEDRKGNDSFNPRRFCLFKVQFKLSALIDTAIHFKEVTQHMTASQGWIELLEFVSLNAVIHCSPSDTDSLLASDVWLESVLLWLKRGSLDADFWLTGAVSQLWWHVPAVTMASPGAARQRAPWELPALCVWDYCRTNQGQQTLELQQGTGDTQGTTNTHCTTFW